FCLVYTRRLLGQVSFVAFQPALSSARAMARFQAQAAGKRWTLPYETSRCLRPFEGLGGYDRLGPSPSQSALSIQAHVRYHWSPSPISDKPPRAEYAQRLQLGCRRQGLSHRLRATRVARRPVGPGPRLEDRGR